MNETLFQRALSAVSFYHVHVQKMIDDMSGLNAICAYEASTSELEWISQHHAKFNRQLFFKNRNQFVNEILPAMFSKIDELVNEFELLCVAHQADWVRRIQTALTEWSLRGFDLLRPRNIEPDEIAVATDDERYHWSCEKEHVEREIMAFERSVGTVTILPDAMLTPRQLAQHFCLSLGAVRKALERLRPELGDDWQEIADVRPNQEKYLYRSKAVEPLLRKMRANYLGKAKYLSSETIAKKFPSAQLPKTPLPEQSRENSVCLFSREARPEVLSSGDANRKTISSSDQSGHLQPAQRP